MMMSMGEKLGLGDGVRGLEFGSWKKEKYKIKLVKKSALLIIIRFQTQMYEWVHHLYKYVENWWKIIF